MRAVKIIEAGSEIGAGCRGASLGPKAVKLEAEQKKLNLFGESDWIVVDSQNQNTLAVQKTPYAKNIEILLPAMELLSETVEKTLASNYFPLIFSGDHSNAIGAVSGFKNHYSEKSVGLIWVDAHFDLHSPYTTPSGNIHGMAVNALIDQDNLTLRKNNPTSISEELWKKLKQLGSQEITPKISSNQLVYIGVRDFESQEMALVQELGIKYFGPQEIKNIGIHKVIEQTINYLSNCDNWYVSFDVDSMDPSISIGTGTPVENGLTFDEAAAVFQKFFHHEKVGAFEITEINPLLDSKNAMAKAVIKLLTLVL